MTAYDYHEDESVTEYERTFYGEALQKASDGPESTGYGAPINQQVRFRDFMLRCADMSLYENGRVTMSLLDLGCGTGDLLAAVAGSGMKITNYLGVDRDERMIEAARKRFGVDGYDGRVRFEVGDADSLYRLAGPNPAFDVVACVATFALKPEDWSLTDVHGYVQDQIDMMVPLSKHMTYVTMFSIWKNQHLPNEMNVNPATMLEWGLTNYGRVELNHSYAPHDFSLIIRTDEGDWWKDYRARTVDSVHVPASI